VAAQLGREPTIPFSVVARCTIGHPLVIRNRPIDPEGHPFPTLYWLTCPDAVRAVSRLESEGWIKRLERETERDPKLREGLRKAHAAYAHERGQILPGAERWGGVGGTAKGLKCLHAHLAHFVAGGPDLIGAWVAGRVPLADLHYGKPGRRLAVINIGTNSTRLLVARFVEGEPEPQELAADTVITRIGRKVDATGRLNPEALRRTLAVVERYARRAQALGAERVRASATSAVRDASNREELATAVQRLTREPLEVLSGEEEGRTAFLGATRGLPKRFAPILLIDIGGGSTEFVLGSTDTPTPEVVSTRIGSVRLAERFLRSDPPSYQELDGLEKAVADALALVEDRIPVHDAQTLVAVDGSSTTVQAVALGLAEYDPDAIHRSTLARADAERVFRLLADMSVAERKAIPVMAPGREDVIPAGAAILVGVMQRWGFAEALISEADIMEGLALRMADETASSGGGEPTG